jgi:chromosome partitioning protein
MHVIALAQQKGGVSKSVLAIHIAAAAVRRNKRAVVLELDKQGTASLWASERATMGSAHDLMKPVERAKLPPEVMKIEHSQLDQTLTVLAGLGVEVVTLDMPGAHNAAVGSAIKAADLVLIPTRPSEVDIRASVETLGVVQRLRKPYAYVLTFVEGKGERAEEAQEALEAEGHRVAPQFIWRRNVYADAVADGETVMEREPKGKAADEIKSLWRWIEKQLEGKATDESKAVKAESSSERTAETRR